MVQLSNFSIFSVCQLHVRNQWRVLLNYKPRFPQKAWNRFTGWGYGADYCVEVISEIKLQQIKLRKGS